MIDKVLVILSAAVVGLLIAFVQLSVEWKPYLDVFLTVMAVISFILSIIDYLQKK
ncbi:MAG TPA: hypothetical protein PLX69_22915 [Leptospiraceae bacterium]|nr:hypothetical protein [Leptospiraceae bacterium]HRG77430.1 hypothetical protein [Leptospiraceae bacterium]